MDKNKIVMLNGIKQQIIKMIYSVGVTGAVDLVSPPKPEMGDFAFACFALAKESASAPNDMARIFAEKLSKEIKNIALVEKVEASGSYINFYLDNKKIAAYLLACLADDRVKKEKNGMRVMIEFAQPNTHKSFHIGHLRGTITGESLSRIMEAAGYDVVRVNYQGDVGMHIAKCLYGILQMQNVPTMWSGSRITSIGKECSPAPQGCGVKMQNLKSVCDKVVCLSEAYVAGAKAFEENEKAKAEITAINEKIYLGEDTEIKELYQETRAWSLEYFEKIYERLDTRFDRFYFESEMFRSAIEIVKEFTKQEVLKQSNGAVIFEGSKYGLHDRVFLNSLGLPTYEAKDLALAKKQFEEHSPNLLLHVVGKEQTEYFKVLFKVLEQVLPESKGKEKHLSYGWVDLKGDKMSSRTGKVVLAEKLLEDVNKKVLSIMEKSEIKNKEEVAEVVGMSALKYTFLKTGVHNDISFDLEESVSLQGDSGPYLLYIVARINSILKKAGGESFFVKLFKKKFLLPDKIGNLEKELLIKIAGFNDIIIKSSESYDPSKIAQYLFSLAQLFNNFYHELPVLKAEKTDKDFRIQIIKEAHFVMTRGLNLLGISTVEEM